eukprot:gene11829-8138_t
MRLQTVPPGVALLHLSFSLSLLLLLFIVVSPPIRRRRSGRLVSPMEGRHVTLTRAHTSEVQQRMAELCTGEDGLVDLIEYIVLLVERSAKGAAAGNRGNPSRLLPVPVQTDSFAPAVRLLENGFPLASVLERILEVLQQYTAQGDLGGVSHRVCDQLQPLLVRLMKQLMRLTTGDGESVQRALWEVRAAGAAQGVVPVDQQPDVEAELVDKLALAMTSCAGGPARRQADAALSVVLPPDGSGEESAADRPLRVVFGFGDHADCETGAMLWGGSMGLTLLLMEEWNRLMIAAAHNVLAASASRAGCSSSPAAQRSFRVLELGCGTAVVSLMAAKRLLRERGRASEDRRAAVPEVEFDITDLCIEPVREALRSVQEKNDADYESAAVTAADRPDVDRGSVKVDKKFDARPTPLGVCLNFFPLDFRKVPAHLEQRYHLVLAGDIVYDLDSVPFIYPALETLLADDGVAVLCCEAHRDGMEDFVAARHNNPQLDVLEYTKDLRHRLKHFAVLEDLCNFIWEAVDPFDKGRKNAALIITLLTESKQNCSIASTFSHYFFCLLTLALFFNPVKKNFRCGRTKNKLLSAFCRPFY